MYKLYWSPASANMTPHAMLEDIGVPYELIKVDTAKGEQHSPDYLKINPHARVPTLVYDDGKVLYETTAIGRAPRIYISLSQFKYRPFENREHVVVTPVGPEVIIIGKEEN